MIKSVFTLLLTLFAVGHVSAQELDSRQIKNPSIKYFPNREIEKNPTPAVVFERGGLASEEERGEIIKKIVYPIVNTSKEPIAAIVVEFPQDKRDQILLSVIFRDGGYIGSVIKKNENGHYEDASDFFDYGDDGCDDGEI